MINFVKVCIFFVLFTVSLHSSFATEQVDRSAIQKIISDYTVSWNQREGHGFGNGFAEDADFVNVFGTHFSGRSEIEDRHVKILQTILKGTQLVILDSKFREVKPGVVIAIVPWRLDGVRAPGSDANQPAETWKGIFTQVFIFADKKWLITASQNTLIER